MLIVENVGDSQNETISIKVSLREGRQDEGR